MYLSSYRKVNDFSWRKMSSDGICYSCQKEDGVVVIGGGNGSSKCGSVFLRDSLHWIGDSSVDQRGGKLKCYKYSVIIVGHGSHL